MMTEKTKRKVNPRRRTLIRLLMGIIIIVVLVSAGMYALRPKGAQIVFIAPDDDGVDNIWIADLNDPEHPKQLTFYERTEFLIIRGSDFVTRPQANNGVLVANGVIVYMNREGEDKGVWIVDPRTKQHEFIRNTCQNLMLHPEGKWVACEEYQRIGNPTGGLGTEYHLSIIVENIFTHEQHVIHEEDVVRGEFSATYLLSWIPESDLLVYLQFSDDPYTAPNVMFYDVMENQIVETLMWQGTDGETIYSDNAAFFVQHRDRQAGVDLKLFVHDVHNPENTRYEFAETDAFGDLTMTYFHDWHPDNETMLISNVYYQEDTDSELNQLLLYNLVKDDVEILSSRQNIMYTAASFNEDASQLLIGLKNLQTYEYQIMLYDMETREEIALPLFGYSPQWVNGGR